MKLKEEKIKVAELVWLFVIGCLIGYVLETTFHFFKNGEWINKQGLLYGPFKPIYGFGLIFIVLVMNRFREKKFWQKFIIGVILGSAFEYFGSLFQEYIFGTSTWNYSHFNLNVGGRIYLPYCLAWGVISVFCINILYPKFKNIDGESMEEVRKRMTNFLNNVLNNNVGKRIVLVSHGAAIKFLLMNWCSLDKDKNIRYRDIKIDIKSPSVLKLEFVGKELKNLNVIV